MTETCFTPESWRAALDIFVTKPHSVDKRLAGQETLEAYELKSQSERDFLFDESSLLEYLSNLPKDDSDSVIKRIHSWLTDLNSSKISTSSSDTNQPRRSSRQSVPRRKRGRSQVRPFHSKHFSSAA